MKAREQAETLMDIPLDAIETNPNQPRKHFDPDLLAELAGSIRDNGLLQPVRVEDLGGGRYRLLMGERRYRAVKSLGWAAIPAIVQGAEDDARRLELALIENLQRADMRPSEEGAAYQRLVALGHSVTAIARKVRKSQPYVDNRLLLAALPEEIRDLVDHGLFPKDTRALNALRRIPERLQVEFARKLSGENCTIRQVSIASAKLLAHMELRAQPVERGAPGLNGNGKPAPAAYYASLDSSSAAVAAVTHDRQVAPVIRYALARLGWTAEQAAIRYQSPPWANLTAAARATCQACALYDDATGEPEEKTCRDCPALELLARLARMQPGG